MRLLVVLILAITATSLNQADAAYTNASIQSQEELGNGFVRYHVRFAGDNREKVVVLPYEMVPAATHALTLQAIEIWADQTMKRLNTSLSMQAALTPGARLSPRIPPVSVRSAKMEWRLNAQTCLLYKGHFTGELGDAITAVCAKVEADYRPGYLDE